MVSQARLAITIRNHCCDSGTGPSVTCTLLSYLSYVGLPFPLPSLSQCSHLSLASALSLLYEKAEDVRLKKGCVSRGEKPQSPSQYAVTARDDPLLEMTFSGVHILLFASTRAVSL